MLMKKDIEDMELFLINHGKQLKTRNTRYNQI